MRWECVVVGNKINTIKYGGREYAAIALDEIFEQNMDPQGIAVGAVEHRKDKLRDKISRFFRRDAIEKTSAAPDEFTTDTSFTAFGGRTPGGGWSSQYYEQTKMENRRQSRYKDYERMQRESTVMYRAVEVMTNNVFMSRRGDEESYQIKSDDTRVEKVLGDLDERVEMPDTLPKIYRNALEIGDAFEELVFDSKNIITRLKWLDPKRMNRHEDEYRRIDAENAFTMCDDIGEPVASFKYWQVVHLRHAHKRGDLYGTSFQYASRRPFKILGMMEDGVAINRLVRASDRLVFYVPLPKTATQSQKEIIVREAKKKFRRRTNVDGSGKLDLSNNPLSEDEDIFIGLEPDSGARGVIGQLSDVEYFQNLMVMATGVPKAYLGLERDVNCLSLKTEIPCLDGETRTIKEIVDQYESGGELPWVYSYDSESGEIVPGRVEWAGVTRKDTQVLEVGLDDGSKHICTPEHVWFDVHGNEIEAQNLKTGQQLMPLRRSIRTSKSYNGYEKIYHNKKRCGLVSKPNHRVKYVRVLSEKEDTADITVSGYHNFFIADAGNGGVLVHNSKATLSWQDVEFARQCRSGQKESSWFQRQVYNRQLLTMMITPEKDFTR
jgi:hypothetical protein